MDSKETLEDLKMTKEEFDRITDAMKNEEFRKLFVEYCEEISDPENRKKYEEEIKILESQRGVECQFVHPNPGYVIKTTDGEQKVFINVAKNDLVDKPKCERILGPEGKEGYNWSLPLIQAPPRKDMDTKHQWCLVYDVIFHPDTLHLADRDKRIRKMVNDTAIDAVQQTFKVTLDTTNLKFPKLSYKGVAKPTVIRKESKDKSKVEDLGPLQNIMPPLPKKKDPVVHKVQQNDEPKPDYTTPKYTIKYRKNLEMHEFTQAQDAKISAALPTHVVIEIQLPLIKNSGEVDLDVSSTRLYLCSEKPAKYKLELKLPYEVDDQNGSARFDKEKRVLTVTLPVVRLKIGVPEILESLNHDEEPNHDLESSSPMIQVLKSEENNSPDQELVSHQEEPIFFDESIKYETPSFTTALSNNKLRLVLTLNSENVDPGTIEMSNKNEEVFVKYESVGPGFFPILYGLVIKFEDFPCERGKFLMRKDRLRLIFDFCSELSENSGLFYGPAFGVLDYKTIKEFGNEEEIKSDDLEEEVNAKNSCISKLVFESIGICSIQK